VQLAHVTVQRFKVEVQLAQVPGLEPVHLEFDGHKAVQAPMEEQEVLSVALNRTSPPWSCRIEQPAGMFMR
jgi:hypothetical protein